MKIGVDASRSAGTIKKTGVEKVSDEIIKRLVEIKGKEFEFYTSEKIDWIPDGRQKVFGPRRLWTVLGLSLEMLFRKPDKLFIPVHTLPFFCPKRTIKVIHDISFRKFPKSYRFWQRLYLNFDLWRCRRICSKIIVPTKVVKDDLIKLARFSEDKVEAVHWGYERRGKDLEKINRKEQILYIGRIEEKKNIYNLIKAFEIFNKKYPEYKLVLAGKVDEEYKEKLPENRNVVYLGYVSEEKKDRLLSESACIVLLSQDEGFGFPILEGFDFGLLVIASDIPALREVGGNACLYVDLNNKNQIAAVIGEAVQRYAELISRGSDRLGNFNWGKAIDNISELIIDLSRN